MKIQAIRKLIMEQKECRILTGQQGQQWIGTKDAIFRVDDGLRIAADSIKGLFDLDQAQTEKLRITEEGLESADIWPVMRRTMNTLEEHILELNNMGGLAILGHGGAVYLAEKRKIKAAVDSADYREYLLAWDKQDNPLIVIRDGMIFAGVMRPLPRTVCKATLDHMRVIGGLEPGGAVPREAEEDCLRLEAEGGQQLDMDDFDVAD